MTCKDCFHCNVCPCNDNYDHHASSLCEDFKNKADVIELPCQLGSEIYMLVTRHTKAFAFENGKMVMRENQHTVIKPTTFTKSNFFKVIEEFGKTVFLTREEAEQNLHT